jgi:hypothetical protein
MLDVAINIENALECSRRFNVIFVMEGFLHS